MPKIQKDKELKALQDFKNIPMNNSLLLLSNDREQYGLGGQAAKLITKKIKGLLGKKDSPVTKELNLKELIKKYDSLTAEELNKLPDDITKLKGKDFDMFMVNEVGLTSTEKDFVLTKYPDFKGDTAADVYKHTKSEKFVDDMYLNNRSEKRLAEAEEAAYKDAGPDDLPFSKGGRVQKQEGGSLLLDDREQYGLGGQAAKLITKKIKGLLGKKDSPVTKELNLKELIKKYDKLTPEQLDKKFNTIDPKTGEWDVTRIAKEDIHMFMINDVMLSNKERAFVKQSYPDFKGDTPADVYRHTKSENFIDEMYENNMKDIGLREAEEAAYKDAGPDDLPFSKGGRVQKQEGGELDDQMNALMPEEPTHTMPDGTEMAGATHGEYEEQMEGLMDKETPMLPDEEMEEDYVDFVIEETLPSQDKDYLISALEKDDRLSEIFDQVVESATEFSGSGPIEGPGSEMSDSIPARLSDGEFVFTAKAVEEIGVDTLTSMMKDAEAEAEKRQGAAYGGMIEDESDPKAVPIQTTGLLTAQGNIPNVVKPNRQVEEEMLKASPRRYYVPLSG